METYDGPDVIDRIKRIFVDLFDEVIDAESVNLAGACGAAPDIYTAYGSLLAQHDRTAGIAIVV